MESAARRMLPLTISHMQAIDLDRSRSRDEFVVSQPVPRSYMNYRAKAVGSLDALGPTVKADGLSTATVPNRIQRLKFER